MRLPICFPMKILVISARGRVLPAICSSMARAFDALGHTVVRTDPPTDPRGLHDLVRLCKRQGVQAVFTVDMGADLCFISQLGALQESLRVPWAIWFVDDPQGYAFEEHCDPRWTVTFCWDAVLAGRLNERKRGPLLHHLPLATDPGSFYPSKAAPEGSATGVFVGSTAHPNPFLEEALKGVEGLEDIARVVLEEHMRDVSVPLAELLNRHLEEGLFCRIKGPLQRDPMAGLWFKAVLHELGRRKRMRLVRDVLGPDGKVYGDGGWQRLKGGPRYMGSVEYGDGLRQVYVDHLFVLEVRQPQSLCALTQRVYDSLACGRPVLCEWSCELEGSFGERYGAFSFHGLAEGRDKARWIRENPLRALSMARRGSEVVLKRHTYLERAKTVVCLLRRAAS